MKRMIHGIHAGRDLANGLVLYGFFPNDDMDDPTLGAVFCNDLTQCREAARDQVEPQFGYSFTQGSDEAGWVGFGAARQGRDQDSCLVEVQTHEMSVVGSSIRIDTESVDVIFDPDTTMGQEVTCRLEDAIRTLASSTDLPCRTKFLLEATRTANL